MTKYISINELRRRFGEIEAELPYLESLVITKNGQPIATLTSAPELKKNLRQSTAGAWRGTDLDDDKLWMEVENTHFSQAPKLVLG